MERGGFFASELLSCLLDFGFLPKGTQHYDKVVVWFHICSATKRVFLVIDFIGGLKA